MWPFSRLSAGRRGWFRGGKGPVVATRPVTGRVGRGRGGPPRRDRPPPASVPPGQRAPARSSVPGRRRDAPPSRVRAAYASLISAMRRVATRDAAGSSPVRSGWCRRASRRQAALIWVGVAPGSMPRTSCGSRFTTAGSYRWSGRAPLDSPSAGPSHIAVPSLRRTGLVAALVTVPFALAYRFALLYRIRAGFPIPRPPQLSPADMGLPFEPVDVHSGDLTLPGWFIPARDGSPGPGVALVHGWESARDRLLPMAVFLHAAGFHCLAIDVRGHGANAAETLPISAGEFGSDALAAFRALDARPEVTVGAVLVHSMGAFCAVLAAAEEPRIAAVVSTSAPADPWRLTRQTFRLARLPFPA